MKERIKNAMYSAANIAIMVYAANFLLDYAGITITIGKHQAPEIYIYPQGSQEQRL